MSFVGFVLILNLLLLSHQNFAQKTDNLDILFKDYQKWKMDLYPESASFNGNHDYDEYLGDFSIEGYKKAEKTAQKFLNDAEKLLKQSKDLPAERIPSLKLLKAELDIFIEGYKKKGYLFSSIDQMQGVQIDLPLSFKKPTSFFKLEKTDDYKNVIKRLEAIPTMIDQIIETLKVGIEEKITLSNYSLVSTFDQYDSILNVKDIEDSFFFVPFKDLDSKLVENKRLIALAKETIKSQVFPAYKKLKEFVKNQYLPKARPYPGVWSNKNGKDFYKACLKFHTTTDLTPEEVHQLGLDEIKKLKEGVLRIAKKMGHGEKTFKEFMKFVRTNPDYKFQSIEDGVKTYNDMIAKINPLLEKIFEKKVLKENIYKVEVKNMSPEEKAFAYYIALSEDGTRNGTFYVNLNNLNNFFKTGVTTLTLHETNPGHHFDFANILNQKFLEDFQRVSLSDKFAVVPSTFPTYSASVEGWGLYSEFLGYELGLYENNLEQEIGYYSFNLLRAARLVVDTGIHYLEWSREKAMEYFVENTYFTINSSKLEIDRYITWPGQATAYKVGELQIRKLRSKLEKEDPNFNLKKFHHSVVSCRVPIYNLESCVKDHPSYKSDE